MIGTVPWNLYTIPGMAVTEAVGLAPIAYVFCVNALHKADASLESAAQVCGARPLRILFRVVIPMLRPPIVYSSILVLLDVAGDPQRAAAVRHSGAHRGVLDLPLHQRPAVDPARTTASWAPRPTIILAVTVLTVVIQAKVLKNAQRFVSVRGKATRPRLLELGWLRWVATAVIVFYVIFGALLPMLGLVFRSFTLIFTPLQSPFKTLTLANYERVFTFATYVQSITNSVVVSLIGAVLISGLALLAVLVARRSTFRFARAIEYLALAPQAMPGIIVGIGFFWAFA